MEDELSDSDSLCELKNITSYDVTSVDDKPRKSDIEQFKDVEPAKEPARKAYLEQSHKSCDYENCGFKESSDHCEKDSDIKPATVAINCSKAIAVSAPVVLKGNRRNSVVSSESNRMETILEEPNDSKNYSVKEILARFETLRETAEVKRPQALLLFSLFFRFLVN